MLSKKWFIAGAAAAALLLSGCAGTFLLDNQVQSFSQLQAVQPPLAFRYERTLSQQADPYQQGLEGLANPALSRVGFRRDDAAARFTVQVAARTQPVLSPYADPWRAGWGLGFGGRHFGLGFGGGFPEPSWYHREVSVVVRDLASNQVVYETHATNDGPWLDNLAVLPAMFDAALAGFPNPPPGPRRVDVQVGAQRPAS